MFYTRVIPRDLFNEAKLLKCMGMLCLNILNNEMPSDEVKIKSEDTDGSAFNITLSEEGNLRVSNIKITINGERVDFHTTYNCKSQYPFYAYYDYVEYEVFDENGEYTKEFIEFCENL